MSGMLALAAKSTLVLVAAAVAAIAMRKASASARHVVWAVAFAALLLLPSLTYVVPRWPVAVLPPVPHTAAVPAPARAPIVHESPDLAPFAEEEMEPPSISSPTHVDAPAALAPVARWNVRTTGFYVWLAGAACGLLHLAIGTGLLGRRVRGATPMVDDEWQRALTAAAAALHVRRTIRLRVSTEVAVPIVWGWLRPVVLIPIEAEDWPEERRRAFLLHEVAHVARFDCVTQTLASIAHSLYWLHPLAWWAMRRLRHEAERACDDRVLAAGTRAPEYAHHLLEAARGLTDSPRSFSPASAIVERTTLGDRLLALLDDRLSRRVPSARTVAALAVLSLLATVGVAALQPVARAAMVQVLDAVVAPLVAAPAASPASAPAAAPAPAPRPIATAAPEPVLSGIVTGADGKPIENALVLAWEAQAWSDPPLHTRTDAKGAFQLVVPGPSLYRLRVEAFPWAPYTVEKVGTHGTLTIKLHPGETIEGIARDERTKKPVAGAHVRARTETGFVAPYLPAEPEAGASVATTDEEGRYRLEGLADGLHLIQAAATNRGSVDRRALAGARDVELFLPEGAGFAGVVKAADGKPVAGAVIEVQGDGTTRPFVPYTRTDARGRFESFGLEPGTYRVSARHPDWAPVVAEVTVQLATNPPLELRVERGFRVSGRLVDERRQAARGEVIVQAIGGVDTPPRLSRHLRIKTGADGRFTLSGVPAGSLTLGVVPIAFAARQASVEVMRRDVDVGDVVVKDGLAVRGTVRSAKGPIAGASIRAYGGPLIPRAESGADGSFVLPGVERGLVRVVADAEGYATGTLDAESGGPAVEIVLDAEARIVGRVVDEAGRAVSQYSIRALAKAVGRLGPTTISAQLTGDGRFEVPRLRPGSYTLHIQAAEHVDKTVADTDVEEGRTTDVGPIVLFAGGTVRGIVVDPTGAPVAGAELRADEVARPRMHFGGAGDRDAVSDGAGRFEFRGLSAGKVKVIARHRAFALASAEVDLDPPAGPAETRLTMTEGSRILGTARQRDGKPVMNAVVTVRNTRMGYFLNSRARVEADGTFTVERVAPGPCVIALLTGSVGQYRSILSKEIDVPANGTAHVDLGVTDIHVSGRVTRDGKPAAGYRVTFSNPNAQVSMISSMPAGVPPPRSGPERLGSLTGVDGRYELLVPVAGKYNVRVQLTSAERVGSPSLPAVQIGDVEAFTHDIDLPHRILTGRVVAKEGGAPLAEATVEARPESGEPGGARTAVGPDGRFQLALDPGTYRMRVVAPKYMAEEAPLTLGRSDTVRTFALERGAEITGSVRNHAGEGIAAARIIAVPPDMTWTRVAHSITDGSFTLDGLRDARYSLLAAHPESGFAFQPGASIGDTAPLTLNPGAKVRFRFKDANGAPLPETFVRIDMVRLDGARVGVELGGSWGNARHTEADGSFEWLVPIGSVELVAWVPEQKLRAEAPLTVQSGMPDVTFVMKPRP
jgi:beta-lactamase regulating signal transducer with metallopeptidase domain